MCFCFTSRSCPFTRTWWCPVALKSPAMTGKRDEREELRSGRPMMRGETVYTNRSLCWKDPAPLKESVRLPWNICGPCGRNLPRLLPEDTFSGQYALMVDHGGIPKKKRMKIASYLEDFTLRTFLKQQRLLIQRIERLPCNLGFLFGFARSVFQQIDLDVGSCEEQT